LQEERQVAGPGRGLNETPPISKAWPSLPRHTASHLGGGHHSFHSWRGELGAGHWVPGEDDTLQNAVTRSIV
jgi:hypothetical protein